MVRKTLKKGQFFTDLLVIFNKQRAVRRKKKIMNIYETKHKG